MSRKTSETHFDRLLNWAKNHQWLAILMLAGTLIVGIAGVTNALTSIGGTLRWLFAPDPLAGIPEVHEFKQWAVDFRKSNLSGVPRPILSTQTQGFKSANSAARPAYATLLKHLSDGLSTYQRELELSIYYEIPPLPESVFDANAANYRAGAIFSKTCSWFVSFAQPSLPVQQQGPVLKVEFMDGDGHLRSGKGVGALEISFEFPSRSIDVETNGIVVPLLVGVPSHVPLKDWDRTSAFLVKRLIEHELQACEVRMK